MERAIGDGSAARPVDILAHFIDLAPQFTPLIGTQSAGMVFRSALLSDIFPLFETIGGEGGAFGALMGRILRRRNRIWAISLRNRNDAARKQNHRQQCLSDTHHNLLCFHAQNAKETR